MLQALLFYFLIGTYQVFASSCFLGQVLPIPLDTLSNVTTAQQAAIQESTRNLKEFCIWNRMGRVAKGIPTESQATFYRARSVNDIETAVKVLESNTEYENHWISSISGHPHLKNKSRAKPLSNKTSITIDDVAEYAETGKLGGQAVSASYEIPYYLTAQGKSKEIPFKNKLGACMYVGGLSKTPSCYSNFEKLLQYISPIGNKKGGLTARPSFIRVLSDIDYSAGLKTAVLKMHNQLKTGKTRSDLFSDINNSFIEFGDSPEKAENKSWEVMAVLSATGPNMAIRLPSLLDQKNSKVNPNAVYLSAIAAMTPHLDTISISGSPPRQYSLPKNVEFSCDSGKNYHFWMSAYLSRMLAKDGVDVKSAEALGYIAELGYQTESETLGRSPASMANWQRFGDTELGVQIDLNLSAAGVVFGAQSTQSRGKLKDSFDISRGFQNSIRAMGSNPADVSESNFKNLFGFVDGKYTSWIEKFSPVKTLQYYSK